MKFNFLGFIKKPITVVDDGREKFENWIAKGLKKIQGNKTVDSAEMVLVGLIITAVESEAHVPVPDEVKQKIQDGFVKEMDKANIAIVHQLEK